MLLCAVHTSMPHVLQQADNQRGPALCIAAFTCISAFFTGMLARLFVVWVARTFEHVIYVPAPHLTFAYACMAERVGSC